jgi:hypothetical protein
MSTLNINRRKSSLIGLGIQPENCFVVDQRAAAISGEPVVSGAEGNFAREFKDARGKVDADLKLGF